MHSLCVCTSLGFGFFSVLRQKEGWMECESWAVISDMLFHNLFEMSNEIVGSFQRDSPLFRREKGVEGPKYRLSPSNQPPPTHVCHVPTSPVALMLEQYITTSRTYRPSTPPRSHSLTRLPSRLLTTVNQTPSPKKVNKPPNPFLFLIVIGASFGAFAYLVNTRSTTPTKTPPITNQGKVQEEEVKQRKDYRQF